VFLGLPFPGFEPGTIIPKSHFTDRLLNRYTTASIQRISLKVHAAICVYKPGNLWFPAPSWIARFFSRSAFCSGVSFGAFFAALRNWSSAFCPSLFVCLGMLMLILVLVVFACLLHYDVISQSISIFYIIAVEGRS
jgi:hypothetical protein